MDWDFVNWREWLNFFERRGERKLPDPEPSEEYADLPVSVTQSLARSLAIFQLGESGGGTIIKQARQSDIKSIDEDYADAMHLFVKEENRHADILAICVRMLGGTLIQENWTANLFVRSRRLIGLRLKVVVLLAAEVVGLCYYHLLAARLPAGQIKSLLAQLVNDERAHLQFHCTFLRSQTERFWKRVIFIIAWRITMFAAAIVVLIDHWPAIRDLGIGPTVVWRRWMLYCRLSERLVTDRGHRERSDSLTATDTLGLASVDYYR